MQNKKIFTLTEHSRQRLSERTSVNPDEIDALIRKGVRMKYPDSSTHLIRLFWSTKDARAYLAVYDKQTYEIITIRHAYSFRREGVVRWRSYTDQGGCSDPNFSEYVKPRHVLKCLKQAGASIPHQLYLAGLRETAEPAQHPKGYTLNLRYRTMDDDYPPVRVLKRLTGDQSPDDVDSKELYALAQEMLGEALGSVVEACVEVKEGKNNGGVGLLLFEIDLDVEHLRRVVALADPCPS